MKYRTSGIELYNENCLETLSRIDSGTIDLLFQDTPYGCTKNDWDIVPDLKTMWPEWIRIAKENAAFLFFAQQPFATDLINSNRKMFRYDVVWKKTSPKGFLNCNKMPLRSHEFILVFYKKLPTYNPQKTTGHPLKTSSKEHKRNSKKTTVYGNYKNTSYSSTERFPTSVITCPSDTQRSSDNSTQKPESLVRNYIRTYSNEGDTVFDGYFGSGTTPAAALKENRRFIGSDIRLDQFNKACTRIKNINQLVIA